MLKFGSANFPWEHFEADHPKPAGVPKPKVAEGINLRCSTTANL
jgi:hypothetical protein